MLKRTCKERRQTIKVYFSKKWSISSVSRIAFNLESCFLSEYAILVKGGLTLIF